MVAVCPSVSLPGPEAAEHSVHRAFKHRRENTSPAMGCQTPSEKEGCVRYTVTSTSAERRMTPEMFAEGVGEGGKERGEMLRGRKKGQRRKQERKVGIGWKKGRKLCYGQEEETGDERKSGCNSR